MLARLQQLAERLESLSPRERWLMLVGVPLVVLVLAETLVFSPARSRTAAALGQGTARRVELDGLKKVLAAQPALPNLPNYDQLLRQRDQLRAQVDEARSQVSRAGEEVDWGTVVRAAVSSAPGLTLTQIRTMPAEQIFPEPGQAKAAPAAGARRAGAPASAPGATPQKPSAFASDVVYRHRAELTVHGEVESLVSFVQNLQRLPESLHWDKLQLLTSDYPQASVHLSLHTLSRSPETPFN
jgi:MSHA biogenesis protein MshJ